MKEELISYRNNLLINKIITSVENDTLPRHSKGSATIFNGTGDMEPW